MLFLYFMTWSEDQQKGAHNYTLILQNLLSHTSLKRSVTRTLAVTLDKCKQTWSIRQWMCIEKCNSNIALLQIMWRRCQRYHRRGLELTHRFIENKITDLNEGQHLHDRDYEFLPFIIIIKKKKKEKKNHTYINISHQQSYCVKVWVMNKLRW